MFTQKYVVLRLLPETAPPAAAVLRSSRGLSQAAPAPRKDLAVEARELSATEAVDLQRDPNLLSAAPLADCSLHVPVEKKAVTDPTEGTAWGIRAVRADTSPYDGRGVTVAVLDTGIDRKHEVFEGVKVKEKDFTGEGDGDENGHGTHCAGTIFGQTVRGIRIGVAPGIERALIGKVLDRLGRGSTQSIMEGIQWALSEGANVISMSLGMDFPGLIERYRKQGLPPTAATSLGLEAYRANLALFESLGTFAQKRGDAFQPTLIVAATGNESDRPHFTIAAAPPAATGQVLAVGALRQGEAGLEVAHFSNSRARLCAPGVDILSAQTGGGWVSMDGTSMATPHVAGVAALWADWLKRRMDKFDAQDLMGKLIGTATGKALAPGFNASDGGLGLVQAPQD